MIENQSGPGHTEDDLSLISLFERLFAFIRNYGLLIALFAVIGMIAGYASYKSGTKQYNSTLLLHSYSITNTEHINIIENWNALLKSGEYDALGERLHCNAATIRKLSSIHAVEIQKLYVQNNPNGFTVDVLVTDNSILDSLQQGIIYGLENSSYMKARLETKRSDYTLLIDKVKNEISKLDSTKKMIENNINSNSQHSSSYIVDISNINTQMIELTEKLLDYQQQLKFNSAVQVLHPFEKFQKPASPRLLKSIVLGFIGGFAIGYILAIYLYIRKKVRMRRR